MKFNHVKNVLRPFDLFSNPVSLRYKEEPVFETATGGLCSIGLMVLFIAVFAGTLSNTIERKYIESTVNQFYDADPSYYNTSTDKFMFAIGIEGLDLNEGERWFDIFMQFRSYNKTQRNFRIPIKFQKCEKEQWTYINETYGSLYDQLNLSKWLCPEKNTVLELQGKFTSTEFKFYRVGVKACTLSTDPSRPCVNQSVIDNYLLDNEVFNFNFYFVNTIINAGGKEYLSTFIDDFNYFPFSMKTGSNANLFVSSYTIKTDQSILPYEDFVERTGGIVLENARYLSYEIRDDEYLKFYIRKATLALEVERSYRKFDDTVSYIGGLFSAILSIFLLMGLYNEFLFELAVAQDLYKNEKDEKDQADTFSLLYFAGYLVFMFFEKFNLILPWEKIQKYHKSMEEIRKQLDIGLILHKIEFADRVAQAVLDKHQIKGLHCQEYVTLEAAEKIREEYELHDKLVRYYFEFLPEVEKQNEQKEQKNKELEAINTTFEIRETEEGKDRVFSEAINIESMNNLENSVEKTNMNLKRLDSVAETKENLDINKEKNDGTGEALDGAEEFENIEEMIKDMENTINLLEAEKNRGNKMSEKILNAMDKRLIEKIKNSKEIKPHSSISLCSITNKMGNNIKNDQSLSPKAMKPHETFTDHNLNSKTYYHIDLFNEHHNQLGIPNNNPYSSSAKNFDQEEIKEPDKTVALIENEKQKGIGVEEINFNVKP